MYDPPRIRLARSAVVVVVVLRRARHGWAARAFLCPRRPAWLVRRARSWRAHVGTQSVVRGDMGRLAIDQRAEQWRRSPGGARLPVALASDAERYRRFRSGTLDQRSAALKNRANWIGAPEFFELDAACRLIVDAFGWNVYLVGSSLERRDFRDVDVRLILSDAEYDAMFKTSKGHFRKARWSLFCSSISMWLAARSGLKIDFQIQRQTEANAENDGRRHALGIFLDETSDEPQETRA